VQLFIVRLHTSVLFKTLFNDLPPARKTSPLGRRVAVWPARAASSLGPESTAVSDTIAVLSVALPVLSTPPATKMSPVLRSVAV
jgi:hypothetical protein